MITFEVHEEWHEFLFQLLLRAPPTASHAPVRLGQLLQADKELWTIMSQNCRHGFGPASDGTLPLETAMKNARLDPF
eukprot:6480998-Amphidinium_carterae.1